MLSLTRSGLNEPVPATPYYVYILACNDGTYYVGCTSNLEDRLKRHSNGWVPATKGRLPIKIEMFLVFGDKNQAFIFEKYLKSGSGRAFTMRHLILAK